MRSRSLALWLLGIALVLTASVLAIMQLGNKQGVKVGRAEGGPPSKHERPHPNNESKGLLDQGEESDVLTVPIVGEFDSSQLTIGPSSLDLGERWTGTPPLGETFVNSDGEFVYFREGPEEEFSVMNQEEALRQFRENCGYEILGSNAVQMGEDFQIQMGTALSGLSLNGKYYNYSIATATILTPERQEVPAVLMMHASSRVHVPDRSLPARIARSNLSVQESEPRYLRRWILVPWRSTDSFRATVEVLEESAQN